MRVIGTAGHVDHGKSTLVQALTGTHPDRLKEEIEREMTIDLGFAFMVLPGGQEIGIVDVPGHRDFIENMLAGVGGIDAALFVVAADEGVMVQTREHLAILNLLNIQGGVVALTKIDLAPDAEWLDLVEEDVRRTLRGTVLEAAPILRVSARQGVGIKELDLALEACLKDRPPRPNLGKPRLPVDRVFSVAGFGTVVTGTLLDGSFQLGDEVIVLPEGKRGRVRGLQSHNRDEKIALPGSRTAINVSGLNMDEIPRGSWVTKPGGYAPTRRMDVRFNLLPDVSLPIRHNIEVKFFLGASEVVGRVRLLGMEELPPGETGWLQLELRDPVVAVRNDRYILRRPSPGETLGGGIVVDPNPKKRHRRMDPKVIEQLESLERGTPADIVLQAVQRHGFALFREIAARAELSNEIVLEAWAELLSHGQVVSLEKDVLIPKPDTWVASPAAYEEVQAAIHNSLASYHESYPLRRGMSREELKSKLKLDGRVFTLLLNHLVQSTIIETDGPRLWLTSHQVRFTPAQEKSIQGLVHLLDAAPYSPPSIKEIQAMVGPDVYIAMVEQGELVPVSPEVVFKRAVYDSLVTQVKEIIRANGGISVADFRDRFNTSRKYALGFLEHLDAIGVTVRQEDTRRLKIP